MSDYDAMFADRKPDAVARVLAESVECHLALLEQMLDRKRTARRAIGAQKARCDNLLWHCRDLHIPAIGFGFRKLPRLAVFLAAPQPASANPPDPQS